MSHLRNKAPEVIITLCLIFNIGTASAAGIYKWTDAQGNTHYGDRPQAAKAENAEKMKINTTPGKSPDQQSRHNLRNKLLTTFEDDRREKKHNQQLATAEKNNREMRCSQAKDTLEEYQQAGYLYQLDEQGERNVLVDEDHQQAMDMAQDAVTHWCY